MAGATLLSTAEHLELKSGATKQFAGGRLGRMFLTILDVLRNAWRCCDEVYRLHNPELMPAGVFPQINRRESESRWVRGCAQVDLKQGRMPASLPVIVSDFPSRRSIVEGDRCGRVVDPQDPAAIAAAIDWMLAYPQEANAMGCAVGEGV